MTEATRKAGRGLAIFWMLLLAASCTTGPGLKPGVRPLAADGPLEKTQTVWREVEAGRTGRQTKFGATTEKQYAVAVEAVLGRLKADWPQDQWRGSRKAGEWTVVFPPPAKDGSTLDPARFDNVRPAAAVPVKRVQRVVAGEGIGLPVVLDDDYLPNQAKPRKLFPETGRHLAATMMVEFPRPREAVVRFVNTHSRQSIKVAGTERQLAYNLTATLTSTLKTSLMAGVWLEGLLRPDRVETNEGVYLVEPYDPKKIPVVFIHGLGANQNMWLNMMNEMVADPELRARYQLWYFLYPTGLSVHNSSACLREALRTAREYYDPEHDDPGMNKMVLIGHSMGGLLARMQVIDSGDSFEKAFFKKPVEKLGLSRESLVRVKRALQFKHDEHVGRVVFITTPHRGSDLAELRILKPLLKLIRLPLSVARMTGEILTLNLDALSPDLMKFRDRGQTSVGTLSPYHPLLKALGERPILVPFHSILGDRGKNDAPNGGDGVVPYWSMHLNGAASETILPVWHCCGDMQVVADEVKRILKATGR